MKTVCITGATSGIGKAIALRMAKESYSLVLTGRRADRLEALKEELEKNYGTKIATLCFDIRDYDAVRNALDSLSDDFKEIDILINNAGLAAGLDPVYAGDVDDWEQMIDTNIKGLLYMTRVVSPGMVSRKSGHIVNIGSIAGKDVYPNGIVYCATKHAVDALSKGMKMDFLPFGIRVTQVCPGAVETEFSIIRFKGDHQRAAKVYEGYQSLLAEDIAEAVLFAVSQPSNVDIQDLLVMPTAQANTTLFHKG